MQFSSCLGQSVFYGRNQHFKNAGSEVGVEGLSTVTDFLKSYFFEEFRMIEALIDALCLFGIICVEKKS